MWESINGDIEAAPGTYKIRCLNPVPGEFEYTPIHRLGGIDNDGVLYIGAASVLSYRLASARKAICAAFKIKPYIDPYVHPAGAHFQKFEFLRKRFPIDLLTVTLDPLKISEDTDVHFKAENDALAAYGQKFGELPPFNLKPGGKSLVELNPT